MAIHKISGNDVNNNGGVVKGSFTSSLLSSNSIKGQDVNSPAQRGYGGSVSFYGDGVLKSVDIATEHDSKHDNYQFSDIGYDTLIPESGRFQHKSVESGDFVVYNRAVNSQDRVRYFIGRLPYIFVTNQGVVAESNSPQHFVNNVYSLLLTNSGTISLPVNETYQVYDVYTGNVTVPSGTDTYSRTITLRGYNSANTNIFSETLDIDYWSKFRVNAGAIPAIVRLEMDCTETNTYGVGRRQTNNVPSSADPAINIISYKAGPSYFLEQSANLDLGTYKGFRFTPSKDMIFLYREIDADNQYSPIVADTIPSGATRTYIPTYRYMTLGTLTGEQISLELMS